MKEIITKSLKQLVADRYLLVLVSMMIVLAIVFAFSVGLSIHASERQLVSHYSAFGMTQFYLGQWFYLFVFVVFGITTALLHATIAIKLLVIKGHTFAIMYAWLGISIILFGWITASKLLGLQALL